MEVEYVYQMEKEHSKSSSTYAHTKPGEAEAPNVHVKFLAMTAPSVVSLCLLSSCEASLVHVKSISFM
jgi:hypothetical protein